MPEDIPSLDVPALEAIGATSVLDPSPGPDLPALARLLVLGAGVRHTKTFREGEVPHFRNYASAGALYPVEVYVGCAELPGLRAGVHHFDAGISIGSFAPTRSTTTARGRIAGSLFKRLRARPRRFG